MFKSDREFIMGVLLDVYRGIVEDDSLDEMTAFMDSRNYNYLNMIRGCNDDEARRAIRSCFRLAWIEKVDMELQRIKSDVWQELFNIE